MIGSGSWKTTELANLVPGKNIYNQGLQTIYFLSRKRTNYLYAAGIAPLFQYTYIFFNHLHRSHVAIIDEHKE